MWGQHLGELARLSAVEVPFSELRQQLVGSLPQRKRTSLHIYNRLYFCFFYYKYYKRYGDNLQVLSRDNSLILV